MVIPKPGCFMQRHNEATTNKYIHLRGHINMGFQYEYQPSMLPT